MGIFARASSQTWEQWPRFFLALLIAQLPFEFKHTLFGLTNLQWTFLLLATISAPLLLNHWRQLLGDRLVQAAILFVAVQWIAAGFAPEFRTNAFKAAIRFTAGLLLLITVKTVRDRKLVVRVWIITAAAAATYALADYAGFGAPGLFRAEEFFIAETQRLSGSFEYPNTAAAYFAMSLPLIWWSPLRSAWKAVLAFLLWCAIVLTFSKGALLAVPAVLGMAVLLSRGKAGVWRQGAALVGVGIAACVALLPVNPLVADWFKNPSAQSSVAAEYTAPWNRLEQQPNVLDQTTIRIRNTGQLTWRKQGWRRVALAYRWWNAETEKFLDVSPIVTELPHDVNRDETIELTAAFRTPEQHGMYVLVLELFRRNFDWFSQTGVVPLLIEANVRPSGGRAVTGVDLSHLYEKGRTPGLLTATVPRSSLWRAALDMFTDRPFGVGPDNYRLQYGKYLGATRWDTHIYSNNLVLELLTGSGFLGVVAFALVMLSIRWRVEPFCLAIAVFLVHGAVDVFLMTTPIYFAFWLLAGLHRPVQDVL